jgi:hypothetical protein
MKFASGKSNIYTLSNRDTLLVVRCTNVTAVVHCTNVTASASCTLGASVSHTECLLTPLGLDVCGSVHHSAIHKEKSNKMQQCIKILLFHIYMKLNMFQATHRPSSGA